MQTICVVMCSYEKLWVVVALEEYLKRTKVWHGKVKSQLLLSFVEPHNPVVSSTIPWWIKIFLKEAGIDTKIFKGHSTCLASTSKAELAGLVLGVMLQPGNSFITDTLSHLQKNSKIKFLAKSFEREGRNGLKYEKRA